MIDYKGDFEFFEDKLKKAGREDKIDELYYLAGATYQEISAMVDIWCTAAAKEGNENA